MLWACTTSGRTCLMHRARRAVAAAIPNAAWRVVTGKAKCAAPAAAARSTQMPGPDATVTLSP